MAVERGQLYWVDFNSVKGSDQRGTRPALVLQNDRGNRVAPTTVVAALSTADLAKRYPFVVPLAAGEAGLQRARHVNCAQIRTVDKSRLGSLIGKLDARRMREVDAALVYELGIGSGE